MSNSKISIEVELVGYEKVIKQLKEIRDLSKEITGEAGSPIIPLGEMYEKMDEIIVKTYINGKGINHE